MAGDGSSSGMKMMDDGALMGMRDGDISVMGAIAIGGAGSKSMKGMVEMKMASSLPGSPGVSQMYHIGATGFFLNHSEHITLTTRQQMAFNGMKQTALLKKSTTQRKIEEVEQELWELAGVNEPDADQIHDTVQAIGKLRGEQWIAFSQSVGSAALILADRQRQMLLGTTEPSSLRANG